MILKFPAYALISTSAIAGVAMLASGASAATVTGTMDRINGLYAYTSSDMTYDDTGEAYGAGTVALICLTAWADAPASGATQSLDAGVGAAALQPGAGELGIAGLHYLVDNYYESYVVNGSREERWSFQQGAWEMGSDFNGNMSSFDAYSGNGDPSWYTSYEQPAYENAWQAMYADLGTALPGLEGYRSTKY